MLYNSSWKQWSFARRKMKNTKRWQIDQADLNLMVTILICLKFSREKTWLISLKKMIYTTTSRLCTLTKLTSRAWAAAHQTKALSQIRICKVLNRQSFIHRRLSMKNLHLEKTHRLFNQSRSSIKSRSTTPRSWEVSLQNQAAVSILAIKSQSRNYPFSSTDDKAWGT